MISTDAIVIATQVYFFTMNAQLKIVIDRTYARYTAVSNKEFYFIMTAVVGNKSWNGLWSRCAALLPA